MHARDSTHHKNAQWLGVWSLPAFFIGIIWDLYYTGTQMGSIVGVLCWNMDPIYMGHMYIKAMQVGKLQ